MSADTKVPLISRARHLYGGRWVFDGQPFFAENERDAEDLIALGFAHRDERALLMTTTTMEALVNAPTVAPAQPARAQTGRRRGVYHTKSKATA